MLYLLFFSLFFLGNPNDGKVIRLSETPRVENGVSFKKLCAIKTEEGFYKSINTNIAENGDIIVLDRGNKKVRIFNTDGQEKLSFGTEGNGPGEFTGYERMVLVANKHIVVLASRKIMIFDEKGMFITEMNQNAYTSGGRLYPTEKGFRLVYDGKKILKTQAIEFDFKGNIIAETPNIYYEERKRYAYKSVADYIERVEEISRGWFHLPRYSVSYGDKFVQSILGEYRIEIADKNLKRELLITRPYKRVKQSFDFKAYFQKRYEENTTNSEAEKKEWMKTQIKRMEAQELYSNGFKDDVQEVLGEAYGYIFVSVSSENDKSHKDFRKVEDKRDFIIEVISPDYTFYTRVHLKDMNIANVADVKWLKVRNNKLVLDMYNEDDGYYVSVFDILIDKTQITSKKSNPTFE